MTHELLKNINGLQILKLNHDQLEFFKSYVNNKEILNIFNIMHRMGNRQVIEIGDKYKYFSNFYHFDSFNEVCDIKKYQKNDSLSSHIDKVNNTDADTIIMINVQGNAYLFFEFNDTKIKIFLNEGDVLILNEDARYKWTHQLLVLTDNRISIIMRNL